MVVKFVEQFYYIAAAMNRPGQDGMWDEEDGFYYDLLRLPDGSATRLKVRSMVGLLPLCATTVTEKWQRERIPRAMAQSQERLRRMPELAELHASDWPGHFGVAKRGIIALLNPERLRRILSKMLDENEFLGPYGIRSISKFHEQHPTSFTCTARSTGWTICRPSRTPACSAATPTGGAGLDASERHDHPGPPEVLPVLRRQFQDRMPHRVGQDDESLRSEQGDCRPAHSDLPP